MKINIIGGKVKVAAMTLFVVISAPHENKTNVSEYSGCRGRDSNLTSPEYKDRALPCVTIWAV